MGRTREQKDNYSDEQNNYINKQDKTARGNALFEILSNYTGKCIFRVQNMICNTIGTYTSTGNRSSCRSVCVPLEFPQRNPGRNKA